VTIGLVESTFLLVVNDDHESILHGYGDTGLQRFWSHEFDLLGRDVIGHVTIGLGVGTFLLVVNGQFFNSTLTVRQCDGE